MTRRVDLRGLTRRERLAVRAIGFGIGLWLGLALLIVVTLT